jgi:hydroxyethylthiazole kinase-like uncharacterized protein yjeF
MSELILTRSESRMVDAVATDTYGIPGMVLMENAGRGVVDLLLQADTSLVEEAGGPVVLVCGKGNNAGDGFVMARHLQIRGAKPRVLLLAGPDGLTGDARRNYEILTHTGTEIIDLSVRDDLANALARHAGDAAWLVDAMLGTGAEGKPREPFATAIAWMNGRPCRRLAVDVPSGLDCDTGAVAEPTLRADITCTFVALKPGFQVATAQPLLGQLHVVSIGIPPGVVEEVLRAASSE